jgi:hypothetical protein
MRRTSIFAALAVTVAVAGLTFISVEVAGAQVARDHRAPSVSRRVPNPGELAPLQDAKGPSVVYAGTSLRCGNTVYHVTVRGGTCGNQTEAMGGGKGCSNNSGDHASANCATGCGDTKGEGADCTITVVQ